MKDRTDTAFHEAGHAVADFLMGWHIDFISMKPNRTTLGRVQSHGWGRHPKAVAITAAANGAASLERGGGDGGATGEARQSKRRCGLERDAGRVGEQDIPGYPRPWAEVAPATDLLIPSERH